MEYRHKGTPAPGEFKTKTSARKATLTVFWNYEGVALTDFLEKGATMNAERYIETLKCLNKLITRKGAESLYFLLQQDNFMPCEAWNCRHN